MISPRGRVNVVDSLLQHPLDQVGWFTVICCLEHPSQGGSTKAEARHLSQIEVWPKTIFSSHHQVGFSKLAIVDALDRFLGVEPFRVGWWQCHLDLQNAIMTQFFSNTNHILPPTLLLVSHVNVLKQILCLPNQFPSPQFFHNHGCGFFTGIHRVANVCETRTSGDVRYAVTVWHVKVNAFVAFFSMICGDIHSWISTSKKQNRHQVSPNLVLWRRHYSL